MNTQNSASDTIISFDYTLIANELDSLRKQNRQQFEEIKQIAISSKEDNRFVSFINNETLFTTLTSITVFIIGFLVKIMFTHIGKIRRKRKNRIYLKYQLARIADIYIPDIISGFNLVANDISLENGYYKIPPTVITKEFKRLLFADLNKILDSVKEKNELSGIINQLDRIDAVVKLMQDELIRLTTIFSDIFKKYNSTSAEKEDLLIKAKAFVITKSIKSQIEYFTTQLLEIKSYITTHSNKIDWKTDPFVLRQWEKLKKVFLRNKAPEPAKTISSPIKV
ncbi:MAG: hypothetical protein PHI28_06380 [Mangrovibacterium sp.]|nr:hypothetical protein [Mangrovibacterium sp.]